MAFEGYCNPIILLKMLKGSILKTAACAQHSNTHTDTKIKHTLKENEKK